MIIFVGGAAFQITTLTGAQWGISLLLGAISLPVAIVIRLIPDEFVAKIINRLVSSKGGSKIYVSNEDRFQWNQGIEDIREELTFLKLVRGGRLNQLNFRRQNMKQNISHIFRGSKSEGIPMTPTGELHEGSFVPSSPSSNRRRRSRSNSAFAAAAMVPSIVAGSIGGWSPVERPGEGSIKFPGTRGFGELESLDGVSVRPGTNSNEPVVRENPAPGAPQPSQQPALTPEPSSLVPPRS